MYPQREISVSSKYIRELKQKGKPFRTPKLLLKLLFKRGTLITEQINRKGLLWNSGLEFSCNHWILTLKIFICFSQSKKQNKTKANKQKKNQQNQREAAKEQEQLVALANKAKSTFASFQRNRQE